MVFCHPNAHINRDECGAPEFYSGGAKLVLIDQIAYIGSANLDTRSLHINFELSLRLNNERVAEGGRQLFAENLGRSRRIRREDWKASRTFWNKLMERWAYFVLARMDLFLARRQLAGLR